MVDDKIWDDSKFAHLRWEEKIDLNRELKHIPYRFQRRFYTAGRWNPFHSKAHIVPEILEYDLRVLLEQRTTNLD